MRAVADAPARVAEMARLTEAALAGERTGELAFDALGVVAAETAMPPAWPRDLVAGSYENQDPAKGAEELAPPTGSFTGVKIYRSNRPNVQPTPSNFFAMVPPNQTSIPASSSTSCPSPRPPWPRWRASPRAAPRWRSTSGTMPGRWS